MGGWVQWVPVVSSLRDTRELVRIMHFGTQPSRAESENLGCGPASCLMSSPSTRWFWCVLEFERNWLRASHLQQALKSKDLITSDPEAAVLGAICLFWLMKSQGLWRVTRQQGYYSKCVVPCLNGPSGTLAHILKTNNDYRWQNAGFHCSAEFAESNWLPSSPPDSFSLLVWCQDWLFAFNIFTFLYFSPFSI